MLMNLSLLTNHVISLLEQDSFQRQVVSLKRDLAISEAPFVWKTIVITDDLPPEIRSGWIFALKGNTPSVSHYHPNSVQHMLSVEGEAQAVVGDNQLEVLPLSDHPEKAEWIVIPKGIPHEFTPRNQDMIVVSFHTCDAADLVEVESESGLIRKYEGN